MADIALNGITTTPSDRISDDGDVAAMLNLVKEDGQLVGIHSPKFVTRIPEGAETYIHKTAEWTHYIFRKTDKTYWVKDAESTGSETEITDLRGCDCTMFVGMAKFLQVQTDNGLKTMLWKENNYVEVKIEDYNIHIQYDGTNNEKVHVEGSNIGKWFKDQAVSEWADDVTMSSFLADMDALKHADMDEREHIGWCFGFIALETYTGEYIRLSDMFVITPPKIDECYGVIYDKRTVLPYGFQDLYVNLGRTYGINIKVTADTSTWNNTISNAVVFLSKHDYLFDVKTKKQYDCDKDNVFGKVYHFPFVSFENTDYLDTLESLPFYKCKEIPLNKFDEWISINPAKDGDTSLSYTDLQRKIPKATFLFSYNGRSHIASNSSIIVPPPSITYNRYGVDGSFYRFGFASPNGEDNYTKSYTMKGQAESIGESYLLEYSGKSTYPIAPLVMIPNTHIDKFVLKNHKDKYYCSKMHLHFQGGVSVAYAPPEEIKIKLDEFDEYITEYCPIAPFTDSDFSDTTTPGWIDESLPVRNMEDDDNAYASLLKISGAEDVLTFPAKNTLTVGTGKIIGMASATTALSTGQFGEFPLYVFTEEGVWSLAVNTTDDVGTYSRAVPVSRDVCINRYSITPIDSGVLFATDRGLMLISGSEVVCLTDVLKNGVQKIKLPKLSNAAKVCGITINSDELSSYIYSNDLHTLLKTCRVLYDYKCQRIVLYSEDDTYAFVFSLNSKTWGMMQYNFVRSLNSYPDCLAVEDDDGQWNIVDLCNNEDEPIPNQYIITRPIKLDASDIMKRISSIIARGNFRNGSITGLMLYGSRDLFNWHLVWTSKNHILRGFSGSPYKYYRVVIFSKLNPDEGITGLSIDAEGSMTNITR